MYFEPGGIYHIYNQGNNKQKIFFNRGNYIFFLRKIRVHIQPYGNILAWCLMPNHFHLMVEVASRGASASRGATLSRTPTGTSTGEPDTLNKSIGIMLASYTRAINLQENTTGSLFRQKTKAICLNEIKGVASNWYTAFGVTFHNIEIPEYQYLHTCFDYIHANPVKAGLVKNKGDWEFSSYNDILFQRDETPANIKRVAELGLVIK
jgi:putative transposase